jgi:hypothetical protein
MLLLPPADVPAQHTPKHARQQHTEQEVLTSQHNKHKMQAHSRNDRMG